MAAPSKKVVTHAKQKLPIWLPLIIVVGAALIVVALIGNGNASATPVPQAGGAPKLVVDKEKMDLGTFALGRTIEVKFNVTNAGDQPLTFTGSPYIEVVKGCCPPTPSLGKYTLKPGEQTTVSFSMMMHEGMGGYHDFRVHLPTNDPGQHDKTVQILSDWQ